MEKDPLKAVRLFDKFFELAPKCDKQYPNALYMLSSLYLTHFHNEKEALRYCNLAEEAERKWRLPFIYPVDIPQKEMMQFFKNVRKFKLPVSNALMA